MAAFLYLRVSVFSFRHRVGISLGVVTFLLLGVGVGCSWRGDGLKPKDDRVEESIVLEAPSHNSKVSYVTTFQWRILNQREGVTYHSTVLTDKGMNPFDSGVEDAFDAGQQTKKTVWLDDYRYLRGDNFEWGVLVKTSDGRVLESPVRSAQIKLLTLSPVSIIVIMSWLLFYGLQRGK